MDDAKALSIGLPVYNGAPHLEAALDSILAQTFRDFELVICDNASVDGTEAICRRYERADARIRYYRAAVNIGAARNYCRVFALSSSPYFKWANADDVMAPELLERCLAALRADPGAVLAYPRTELIDAQDRKISDFDDRLQVVSSSPSRRFEHVIEHLGLCNVVYGVCRRDALERTGLMGSYLGSDRVLTAELALQGRFHLVPEILFSRRVHSGAYSSQTDPAARVKFYNPQSNRRIASVRWRNLWEYFRVVERSDLPARERMRACGYLLKTAVWQRRALVNEARLLIGAFAGWRVPQDAA